MSKAANLRLLPCADTGRPEVTNPDRGGAGGGDGRRG